MPFIIYLICMAHVDQRIFFGLPSCVKLMCQNRKLSLVLYQLQWLKIAVPGRL